MKAHLITIWVGLAFCSASSAAAQSSDFDTAFAPRGAEARVSLIIPFGGDTKSAKSKPQLALVGRQYQSDRQSINWAMKTPHPQEGYRESRLALTLSSEPTFLLNGQVIGPVVDSSATLSDDVKTAGKVALGAGVITLTVVAVVFGVYIVKIATHDGPLDGG